MYVRNTQIVNIFKNCCSDYKLDINFQFLANYSRNFTLSCAISNKITSVLIFTIKVFTFQNIRLLFSK